MFHFFKFKQDEHKKHTGLTFFQLADLGIVCKLDADKAVVVATVFGATVPEESMAGIA